MKKKHWKAYECGLGWCVVHLERAWVVQEMAIEGCATEKIAKQLAALMNAEREQGENEAARKFVEVR